MPTKKTASDYEVSHATFEARFGNAAEAKQRAAASLALAKNRDTEASAGIALAIAGDEAQAQKLADDLTARLPDDTIVKFIYVPTIRAARGASGKRRQGDRIPAARAKARSAYQDFFALWKDADPASPS